MIIHGLQSTIPIVKEYRLDIQGQIEKTPYPFVYEFTSTDYEVVDIHTLYSTVAAVSQLRACLLKGRLSRQLVADSRAGSTNPETPTEWICLDLDGVQGVQSVDLFLQEIGLGDVDHVLQWSSSMGIENHAGFRCHIFMLLDKPTNPALLKQWLQHLNLTSPVLLNSMKLTKTYNSVTWPLDVTTCQNDKLLYVASPVLEGVADPFTNRPRISLEQRGRRKASLPENIPSATMLRDKIDAKVNELRKAAGYTERKASKYAFAGEVEYLAKPDAATITGSKIERGFCYFNLNGGDSCAYYHPEDNPAFIYNFKGEPTYRTSELLPQYWASITQRVKDYKPDTTGKVYLVFRDLHTASYWNGTYDTTNNKLDIYKANSKEQLHDYMKQHGQPIGDYIPDWVLGYDPHNSQILDATARTINTFQPTEYLSKPSVRTVSPPPTINKMVSHFLGYDQPTIDHFYNWLAVVAQKLDRTGTCWVIQGIQGTGKGLFFHRVLTPIFGSSNVVSKRGEEIGSDFTSYFRNKLVIYIDEMEVGQGEYFKKVTSRLKNLIVEPTISIRPMYHEAVEVRNYGNIIFSTNKLQGAQIDMDDRRYNVGAYQRQKLTDVLTDYDIDVLIPAEVEAFAHYLRTRNADVARARLPLDNAPRRLLQAIGQTAIDEISMHLKKGNLEYFVDYISDPDDAGIKKYAAQAYRDLIVGLVQTQRPYLTRADLQIILAWLLDSVPNSPVKFGAYIKHHDMELTPQWINGKTLRVLPTPWKLDPQRLQELLSDIQTGTL